MDFSLTKEQTDIQKAAEEFAKGNFDKEVAQEHEINHSYPHNIRKKACELGFIGIHIPETFGGQGYGILENALVVEAFCRQDSGLGIALSLVDFGTEIILKFGTDHQKVKYLIPIVKGETISSAGFTEPDHGSDITFLNTSAEKKGDEYIINGSKIFITNSMVSDFVLVLCQTNSKATPSYRGQSIIIVERGTPGYVPTELGQKMGIKMTSTGELSFTDVRVPVENLVGEENRGFYQALEFFNESRIEIAAQALGIAQGAFDRALAYVNQRLQFGRKLAQFQVTQHKLADMATKIETARLITYKAAWMVDHGNMDPKVTSMAKMYTARTAIEVADESIQMLGGYGYMLEYEVERFYRDAKITEIYEGTREIQKNTIARSILGIL